MSKVIIGGDVLPPEQPIKSDDVIAELFSGADLFLLNLEAPIIGEEYLKHKRVSLFKNLTKTKRISASPQQLGNIPKDWSIIWGLANNHIGDYGKEAINKTLTYLEEREDRYIGHNRSSVFRSLNLGGKKILIYNINLVQAEIGPFELNINNRNVFYDGPSGIDRWFLDELRGLSQDADLVLGYIHLGRCGYSDFRDRDKRQIQKINDAIPKSVSHMVAGHHSHQAGEIYSEGNMLVFSSLGNMIFNEKDGKFSDKFYYNFLLELVVEESISVNVIPIIINDTEILWAGEKLDDNFPAFQKHYYIA